MKTRVLVTLLAIATVGCGPSLQHSFDVSERARVAAGEPKASASPAATVFPESAAQANVPQRKIQETTLANGVRLLVAERKGVPLVSITVASSVDAPRGVVRLRTESLGNETKTRDAHEIWTQLTYLAARLNSTDDESIAFSSVNVLASVVPTAMRELLDVSLDAAFRSDHVDQERSNLRKSLDTPSLSAMAHETMRRALYPEKHPYAMGERSVTKEAVSAPREAVVALQDSVRQHDPLTIAIVGDITFDRAKAIVEPLTKMLPKRADLPALAPAVAPPKARSVVFVSRPGSQAYVLVGSTSIDGEHADMPALRAAVARLDERARFQFRLAHGASYGGGAEIDSCRGPSPIFIGGQLENKGVTTTLRSILDELKKLDDEPLAEKDRAEAVQRPSDDDFYSSSSISSYSGYLAARAARNWPLDTSSTRAISSADIQRVARLYLPADRLPIVVVGDEKEVLPQLTAMGLGEIRRETFDAK